MSKWGRAQDALHNLLGGFEVSQDGQHQKGLLEDKFTWQEIHDLIEPILEAVAPIFSERPAVASPIPQASLQETRRLPETEEPLG